MEFYIENMTCGGCARGVTKAIQSVDENAKVIADPPSHSVKVETTATQQQVVDALSEAGFLHAKLIG
jgi:copper chaperone